MQYFQYLGKFLLGFIIEIQLGKLKFQAYRVASALCFSRYGFGLAKIYQHIALLCYTFQI